MKQGLKQQHRSVLPFFKASSTQTAEYSSLWSKLIHILKQTDSCQHFVPWQTGHGIRQSQTMHSNLRFCCVIKFTTCGISSDFSAAGQKHVTGISQSSEHVLHLLWKDAFDQSTKRWKRSTKRRSNIIMAESSIWMSSTVALAFIGQIPNSQRCKHPLKCQANGNRWEARHAACKPQIQSMADSRLSQTRGSKLCMAYTTV